PFFLPHFGDERRGRPEDEADQRPGGYGLIAPGLSQQEPDHSAVGEDQVVALAETSQEVMDAPPELGHGLTPWSPEPLEGQERSPCLSRALLPGPALELAEVDLPEPRIGDAA